MNKDTIRQASVADIPRLIDLLHQVDMVHQFLSWMEGVFYLPFSRRAKAITREI